jgi:hypothetical protein
VDEGVEEFFEFVAGDGRCWGGMLGRHGGWRLAHFV